MNTGRVTSTEVTLQGFFLFRIIDHDPVRAGSDAGQAPGTFLFIDHDEVHLLVRHDGFLRAGSLTPGVLALLAGDRDSDPNRERDHFDAGFLGIEGSSILQGTHELANLATGADAVSLVRQGDVKDAAPQAFGFACCTGIGFRHILSPFFRLAEKSNITIFDSQSWRSSLEKTLDRSDR
jgi:hypothetical protein